MEEQIQTASEATEASGKPPIDLDKRVTLTVEEVHMLTGLPLSNIYNLCRTKRLRSKKQGKRIVISKKSFLEIFDF